MTVDGWTIVPFCLFGSLALLFLMLGVVISVGPGEVALTIAVVVLALLLTALLSIIVGSLRMLKKLEVNKG